MVHQGWGSDLATLAASVQKDLFVCSPFISEDGVEHVLRHLPPPFHAQGRIEVLTDLSWRSAAQGATDPRAVLQLARTAPESKVHHLPGVHAKAYISHRSAILTSGNLTASGLFRNIEYGVKIQDADRLARIRADFGGYAQLVP